MSDDDEDRVDRAVAILEAARDLPSLPAHLAPLLRALRARADAASSSPRWLALTALADHATRRELLVEVLVDSIRRCGAGGTVGDVAEVCLTLADAGVVLDNDSVNPVVGALTQLRGRLDPAAAAVRLRLVTAAIEQIADGPAAERIDSEVWWGEGAAIAGGRLWRAALALRLTERVRAARQLAVLQQSLHDHPEAARQLPRTLLEPISTLLRYTSSSVLGLLLGRDARATATTGAEERR